MWYTSEPSDPRTRVPSTNAEPANDSDILVCEDLEFDPKKPEPTGPGTEYWLP